jgi:isopenicillin N synthase-like dioxygenase
VKGNPALSIPPGAESRWSTICAFNNQSHQIASDLLSSLSDSLGLVGPNRYECYHVADQSSTTTTVLQHYPHRDDLDDDISVGHFTHTDTGSITILFNTEWGLQVHSPYSDTWEWIPPHPDYAIVNIGDTLRFMSNKRLRSSLHRVVPAIENWKSGSRYATIFFLRANNDAQFVDSEGRSWKASDWLMRKFGGYRQTHAVQATTAVSTGKTGFVGLWEDRNTNTNGAHAPAEDDVMDRTAWKNLIWSSASY